MSKDNEQLPAVVEVQANHVVTRFDRAQIDLIKRTVCTEGTDDELRLFLTVASKTGLDPFARQIHAVHRQGKMTIQTGIDGYRLIAERTGEVDGQEGPEWCDTEGNWYNVWTGDYPPHAAKVDIYRKGRSHPFRGIAHLSGYMQTKADGTPVARWGLDPAGMLAKCAESLGLRKAFPQELSGLYADVEMDQADSPKGAPRVAMPQQKKKKKPPAKAQTVQAEPVKDQPAQSRPQAPPPGPSGDEDSDTGIAHVRILDAEEKHGTNDNGPWVLTKAKADDGHEYRTFSTSSGTLLKTCAGTDETVIVRWKKGRYGREVASGDDACSILEPVE